MNLAEKRLFLLDMDGTIYLGSTLFDKTVEFLEYIKKISGRYIFLTNNSSKSVAEYVNKLAKMGINVDKDDFLTSAQATAHYLKKKYAKKNIYVMGTKSFREELQSTGLSVIEQREEDIACLVIGFDTELTFQKLEDACILLGHNVDYVATNPDLVCPTEFGYVPDCGSISIMLKNATGCMPKVIGKPHPEMALMAIQQAGFSKEETLLVGDRLYTDIACGNAAGIDTALVLSGEATLEQVEANDIKPDAVFSGIEEILDKLRRN